MPKVSNSNTRTRCQPCPNPTMKTNNWYLYIYITYIHTHTYTYIYIYIYIYTYIYIYIYIQGQNLLKIIKWCQFFTLTATKNIKTQDWGVGFSDKYCIYNQFLLLNNYILWHWIGSFMWFIPTNLESITFD